MSLELGEFHTLYVLYPDSGRHYNPFVCALGRETAGATLSQLDFDVEFVWADSALSISPSDQKNYLVSQVSLVQFGDVTLNNQNYCYDTYFVKYRTGDLGSQLIQGQAVSYNDTTKVLSFQFYGLQRYTNPNIKVIWLYFDFFGEEATFKPTGVRSASFGADFGSIPLERAGLQSISDTTQTFSFNIAQDMLQLELTKMIMDTDMLWFKFRANQSFPGCYGYGERRLDTLNLCKSADTPLYTLWNNNQHREGVEEGVSQGRDGSHPVLYFVYSPTPTTYKYFALFFLNTNAQELKIEKPSSTTTEFTFISTGGMGEFYFINPTDSFEELITGYQSIVGHPPLIPFSALGFHTLVSGAKDT